jgi:CelD/BcsL family acetyltransferase involved in cellulose biosynthesis
MTTSVELNTSAKSDAGRSTNGLIPAGTTPLHRLDGELWVEIVDPRAQPPQLAKDWDDLASNASDPNVFFERWFLAPAMASFGAGRDVILACVHRGSSRKDVAPAMVGLFPLERSPGGFGRARTLKLFWNQYTFLQTPLVRQGHEVETWDALLKWTDERSGCDLIDLPLIRGEGTVGKSLAEVVHRRRQATLISSIHTRAVMRRCGTEEEFLSAALTSKQRHQYERQARRLAEQGTVEYRRMAGIEQAPQWIDWFVDLESRGWKGDGRTALADDQVACQFVRTMLLEAAERGRLQAVGIWLNGRPIALKLNLIAAPGSFAFKIAYDEAYSKFSPGVLLELENIRLFHEGSDAAWMDSCAAPDHPMINRLWRDRILLQQVLLSTGTRMGELAVGLRPLGRVLRRVFSRRKKTAKQEAPKQEAKAV